MSRFAESRLWRPSFGTWATRSRSSSRVVPLKVPLSWSTRSRRRTYAATERKPPPALSTSSPGGGGRVIFKTGRFLGHIFDSIDVYYPILIFMPLARGAACGQSRASACDDEQRSPVCVDTTQNPPCWELEVAGAVVKAARFGHSKALWDPKQK